MLPRQFINFNVPDALLFRALICSLYLLFLCSSIFSHTVYYTLLCNGQWWQSTNRICFLTEHLFYTGIEQSSLWNNTLWEIAVTERPWAEQAQSFEYELSFRVCRGWGAVERKCVVRDKHCCSFLQTSETRLDAPLFPVGLLLSTLLCPPQNCWVLPWPLTWGLPDVCDWFSPLT